MLVFSHFTLLPPPLQDISSSLAHGGAAVVPLSLVVVALPTIRYVMEMVGLANTHVDPAPMAKSVVGDGVTDAEAETQACCCASCCGGCCSANWRRAAGYFLGLGATINLSVTTLGAPHSLVSIAAESEDEAAHFVAITVGLVVMLACTGHVLLGTSPLPARVYGLIGDSSPSVMVTVGYLGWSIFFIVAHLQNLPLPAEKESTERLAATGDVFVWLYMVVLLSPALPLAFRQLLHALVATLPPSSTLSLRAAAGALVASHFALFVLRFLVLCSYNASFTLPFLKNMYWVTQLLLVLAAGLPLGLSLLDTAATAQQTSDPLQSPLHASVLTTPLRRGVAATVLLLVPLILVSVGLALGQPRNPLGYSASASELPAAPGGRVRVATFNIHLGYGRDGERNRAAMADEIRALEVDLICLQESSTVAFHHASEDVLGYLAKELDMGHHFMGRRLGDGLWGASVLSRLPLRDFRTVFLPSSNTFGQRSAAVGFVGGGGDGGGDGFAFGCTHLTGFPDIDECEGQLDSVFGAVEAAAARGNVASVVIAGDLNIDANAVDANHTALYTYATATYNDTWALAAAGSTVSTFIDVFEKGERQEERLDYVLVSSGISVPSTGVGAGAGAGVPRHEDCAACMDRSVGAPAEPSEAEGECILTCSASDHLAYWVDLVVP